MLPRIGTLDRLFGAAVQYHIRAKSRGTSFLQDIKAHVIHEGTGSALRRSPTEIEPTEMKEASVETKLPFDEIDKADAAYVFSKADEIAEEFNKQFSAGLLKTVEDVTRKTGLIKDAGGMPLTNEVLIEMVSMMNVDFERSNSGDLTIVTAPGMVQTFERLEKEMRNDPEIRAKWNKMMEAKRNEFREREINRNLAG